MSENNETIALALDALASAWRGDWSDFDGRTLRLQLSDLSAALRADEPFDLDRWLAGDWLCIECGSWPEHCRDREAHRRPPWPAPSDEGTDTP